MAAATQHKSNTVFSQKRSQESVKPHLRSRQTQCTLSPIATLSPKSPMAASTAGSRRGILETLAVVQIAPARRSTPRPLRSCTRLSAVAGEAIDKVMKNNPAMFLKLLVLLVPPELPVEHSSGPKAMTHEQLARGLEMLKEMLAKREAGANAKVIEGEAMPSLPAPTAVNAKSS